MAPEIRSIQDRYKKYSMSDPRKRKMNEEVMAVYSREGINPMGSCLPMLIQLPFLWAFYRMLSGAIELRHAPWIMWIHDLSAKDPYYILPIAMTLHVISDDENDIAPQADDGRPGATKNDDVHAADDGSDLHQPFQRTESLLLPEQPGGHGAA